MEIPTDRRRNIFASLTDFREQRRRVRRLAGSDPVPGSHAEHVVALGAVVAHRILRLRQTGGDLHPVAAGRTPPLDDVLDALPRHPAPRHADRVVVTPHEHARLVGRRAWRHLAAGVATSPRRRVVVRVDCGRKSVAAIVIFKLYHDLDWSVLFIFNSKHLLGCWLCMLPSLIYNGCRLELAGILMLENANEHQHFEACLHFLTSKRSQITQCTDTYIIDTFTPNTVVFLRINTARVVCIKNR